MKDVFGREWEMVRLPDKNTHLDMMILHISLIETQEKIRVKKRKMQDQKNVSIVQTRFMNFKR